MWRKRKDGFMNAIYKFIKYSCIIIFIVLFTPVLGAAQSIGHSIVINAGIPGNNTKDLLARMNKDCLSHLPDLTILMIGTNDMLNNNKYIPLEVYKQNLNKIIDLIQAANSQVLIMNILPVYEPYLLRRHPKEFYKPEGVSCRIKQVNNVIKEIAEEQSVYFLDIYHIFNKVGNVGLDQNSLIQNRANSKRRDGVHPTMDGYRVLAVTLYTMILNKKIPHHRIVCFGDSITFGSGSPISYPEYLVALLNN